MARRAPKRDIDISFLQGQGVDDLIVVFDAMPKKVQGPIAKKITKAGAKVILPRVLALTPVDTSSIFGKNDDTQRFGKHLKDTIKVRAGTKTKGGIAHDIRTGTKSELGLREDSKWYYPAHVELGFTRHGRTVAAQSYMRAGFDQKMGSAVKIMGIGLFKELKQTWLGRTSIRAAGGLGVAR
jgi:hypothetical protein